MVFITGGAGFIGSHISFCLLNAGFDILVLDNFSNSYPSVIDRLRTVKSRGEVRFIQGDVLDESLLTTIFADNRIDIVIHLAGVKSVTQSVQQPLLYYQQNVKGSMNLLEAMASQGCFNLVFSSSASVYGDAQQVPVSETYRTSPKTPYGRSKLMVEKMLEDVAAADPRWSISILRYFNPVGAHDSGLLGDLPRQPITNLFPLVADAVGNDDGGLTVFGNDYKTPDGTGVRDYIHVMDLAQGHVHAMRCLKSGCGIYNLGTGRGYSVLEVIEAFERITGHKITYKVCNPRKGDIGSLFASTSKAERDLGWKAVMGLDQMIYDYWRWRCLQTSKYDDS